MFGVQTLEILQSTGRMSRIHQHGLGALCFHVFQQLVAKLSLGRFRFSWLLRFLKPCGMTTTTVRTYGLDRVVHSVCTDFNKYNAVMWTFSNHPNYPNHDDPNHVTKARKPQIRCARCANFDCVFGVRCSNASICCLVALERTLHVICTIKNTSFNIEDDMSAGLNSNK